MNTDFLEPRTPIKNGEWVVTVQLEIDEQPHGDPLELRYVDTMIAGKPKKHAGNPHDIGYLLSRAIHQRALQLKPGRRKK
jgi:hypothetical protein